VNRKGVCFDVVTYMAFNWRLHFSKDSVRRELEIIKEELHCNAVRISGSDMGRLSTAAELAMKQGLEVWFCPTILDRSRKKPAATLAWRRRQSKQ
jgi:hypothetical protein